jgi:SNF2 family DNA or RNA helicase
MRRLFGKKRSNGKWGPPTGKQMLRLLQLLHSFVVRRPESTIALPPLHVRTVLFKLTPEENAVSQLHCDKYMIIIHANSDAVLGDEFSPWGRLTLAIQHACHPALETIMHLVKTPDAELDEDLAAGDVLSEAKDIAEWVVWKEEIERNENWRSSRVNIIIDIFNEFRDKDPDCSVIVFDESVYFLDIVEVAFSKMFEPEACLRYDGRIVAEKRTAVLEEFARPGSPRVLLASRAAGGIGLNITTANKVIICGPWWKIELEEQAIKRAHRPGQTREVEAVKVQADCEIETYKVEIRDSKHKHNSKIVASITRDDGVLPVVWDNL